MAFLTQAYYDASKYFVKCGEDDCTISFPKTNQVIFLQYQREAKVVFVSIEELASVDISTVDNSIRIIHLDCETFENNYLESAEYSYQICVKDGKKCIKFNYNIEERVIFKVCIETEGIFDDEVEPIRLDFSINAIDLKEQDDSNKDDNRKIHFDLADYR